MSVGAESPHLPRKRGRRPNLSDEVVRERMFGFVEDEIRQRGFSLSVAHLVFEDIVRNAGVSRAAAFRLWPTRDDFNLDVLIHIIERLVMQVVDDEVVIAADAMMSGFADAGRRDWDAGLAALSDVVDVLDATVIQSHEYLLALAARFWLFSSNEAGSAMRLGLVDALKSEDHHQIDRFSAIVEVVMHAIGFRMRPSVSGGSRTFVRLMIVILEGASVRHAVMDPAHRETVNGLFLGGAVRDKELSIVAAGVAAVAAAMMEPIPAGEQTAAPTMSGDRMGQLAGQDRAEHSGGSDGTRSSRL